MFTCEIKINGSLIIHIYGRNTGLEGIESKYEIEVYQIENKEVKRFTIKHQRADGLAVLIENILHKYNHG